MHVHASPFPTPAASDSILLDVVAPCLPPPLCPPPPARDRMPLRPYLRRHGPMSTRPSTRPSWLDVRVTRTHSSQVRTRNPQSVSQVNTPYTLVSLHPCTLYPSRMNEPQNSLSPVTSQRSGSLTGRARYCCVYHVIRFVVQNHHTPTSVC
jgi:hypothetical protein